MNNMSDNGSQIVSPSDLRDASRERLLAEIGSLQHHYGLAKLESQIVQLKRELADSEMRLLQARDYARGCAAELGEAKANFSIHQQLANRQVRQARRKLQELQSTRTWKMGRLIMLPARILRRILKGG
jgi:predicted  nucleic acid-binding Zn-ribbon protein